MGSSNMMKPVDPKVFQTRRVNKNKKTLKDRGGRFTYSVNSGVDGGRGKGLEGYSVPSLYSHCILTVFLLYPDCILTVY